MSAGTVGGEGEAIPRSTLEGLWRVFTISHKQLNLLFHAPSYHIPLFPANKMLTHLKNHKSTFLENVVELVSWIRPLLIGFSIAKLRDWFLFVIPYRCQDGLESCSSRLFNHSYGIGRVTAPNVGVLERGQDKFCTSLLHLQIQTNSRSKDYKKKKRSKDYWGKMFFFFNLSNLSLGLLPAL